MFESLFTRDIVNKEGTNRTAVVWPGYRSEVLLTSRVPYLQLDGFISNFDILRSEFNANCYVVTGTCLVLDELQDNAGFTNAWVSRMLPESPITMNLNK